MTWLLVPLAFAAMGCQDILSVWLVRAESQGRAHAAARWDTAGDACRLAGQATAIGTVLLGHDLPLKVAVVVATLAADYLGTYTGVRLSARLERTRADTPGQSRTVPVKVQVSGALDDQFWAWLRKNIRPGGDGRGGVPR